MEKVKTTVFDDQEEVKTKHEIYFHSAKNLKNLPSKSVHLIITSPPYWKIKDYGNEGQIGFNDSLLEYFEKLNKVWYECIRLLHPGCKLCINMGDQFFPAIKNKRAYQIIPLHSILISELLKKFKNEIVYLGTINWNKVSTSNTSGGGHIMGSIYFPRNGYFFINREYVIVFRKLGKDPKPNPILKEKSKLSLEEWRIFFKDSWNFPGIKQDIHDAMFPEELPNRLIKMYSFIGDTILDPFLGSGTTIKVAVKLGRNSIGYEIGFNRSNWKEIIKKKVKSGYNNEYPATFCFYDFQ